MRRGKEGQGQREVERGREEGDRRDKERQGRGDRGIGQERNETKVDYENECTNWRVRKMTKKNK